MTKPNLTLKRKPIPKKAMLKKLTAPKISTASTIPLRLGYACINWKLCTEPKPSQQLSVNRSCVAKTFKDKGAEHAIKLARKNLTDVLEVLKWNEAHGIRLYRLSSSMFPHATNPDFIPPGEDSAYDLELFAEELQAIGVYARAHGHRLTFHPGQFNQVGTPNRAVFEKTRQELLWHARVLDLIGCGPESVMVIHGGGVYGDRKSTLERWVKQFHELPETVRNRLVIENCERSWSPLHMLELSERINRPIIFDTHHHACYHQSTEELPNPATFLPKILETWKKHQIRPKFHISEQNPTKRLGAHSDFVNVIPDYLLDLLRSSEEIDLMIEAKMKEQAVLQLCRTYGKQVDSDKLEWFFRPLMLETD